MRTRFILLAGIVLVLLAAATAFVPQAVRASEGELPATDRTLGTVVIIGRIVLLLMVATAGWWLLRAGLKPIREVTRVAKAISSGDRSRRLQVTPTSSDAGRLTIAFNEMLDQQHAAEDQLRRFIADASHELRTPVTAIGGFADLYRQNGIPPDELDGVMRRIGQESARMKELVEDMLLLARLDEGRAFTAIPIDLVPLVSDAILDASATHPSRRAAVSGSERAVVVADETQLRQLLGNLLANALSYTKGYVDIQIEIAGDYVTLTVTDEGPGLEPDEADRVFDRFWRGTAARGKPGSGLGLPIVRGIAQAHGGSLQFTSSRIAGTSVSVVLPAGQQTDR